MKPCRIVGFCIAVWTVLPVAAYASPPASILFPGGDALRRDLRGDPQQISTASWSDADSGADAAERRIASGYPGREMGCVDVEDGQVGSGLAIVLSLPAAMRDVVEIPLRLPYVLVGWVDPGHPTSYLLLPFIALGSLHSVLFFSGTDAGYEKGGEIIFESARCGWYLFPNLRTLW